MPRIIPEVVRPAYEYEVFTSVHTIYSDNFGLFGALSSLACVLSSYTISCRGSTNVTVRITGSTLTVSGYYGDVFDQDVIDYRNARRITSVTSIYNYNDLPAKYWKATKYFPDQRPTTSIAISIVTNNGTINTTQIVKNNWDYKLARIRSFITNGDLDKNDIFVSGNQQDLPDLIGPLVWKTTTVTSSIVTSITTTAPPVVSYLIVAGGGSGGPSQFGLGGGGGGGAGGLLSGTTTITSGNVYTFTVGSGGAAGTANGTSPGNNGGNSTAFGLTALGGGGGGNGNNGGNSSGLTGGSGGGGGYRGYTTQSNGASGTAGQGNAGSGVISGSASGGGGGGAGGAGQTNSNSGGPGNGGTGGPGGLGVTWLDGNVYATGGQGGYSETQANATPGTGNGGIGTYAASATFNGASGAVLLRYSSVYADASVVTGNYTYTNIDGFKTYKFLSDGSITFANTNVKSVSITLYGGSGGQGLTAGGQGGTTTWSGTMAPGVVLTMYVAGQGTNSPGGIRSSGGGGGGSAVLANGTLIAVAGGGGGGGSGTDTIGGSGGGSTGATGGNSTGWAAFGGAGGSQSGPGAGGSGDRYPGIGGSGTNGGDGTGFAVNATFPGGYGYGTGGRGLTDNSDGGSGGGGGGYFGGGGGGGSANGAGGGGGSGYFRNTPFTNVTFGSGSTANGGRTGNGQIIVIIDGVLTTYNYTGSTQSITI